MKIDRSAEIKHFYHYYEKRKGPFVNLSGLDIADAKKIQIRLAKNEKVFAAKRPDDYLERRHELENIAYRLFLRKGGKPRKRYPHYMVLEECRWLETWYESPAFIKIPIASFDMNTVSFSYGDLFPTFDETANDGKEYRKKIYTYEEILALIKKYGLPQVWNPDGTYGPERYVEAHVWDDEIIGHYK
jgi:hypothetical protein